MGTLAPGSHRPVYSPGQRGVSEAPGGRPSVPLAICSVARPPGPRELGLAQKRASCLVDITFSLYPETPGDQKLGQARPPDQPGAQFPGAGPAVSRCHDPRVPDSGLREAPSREICVCRLPAAGETSLNSRMPVGFPAQGCGGPAGSFGPGDRRVWLRAVTCVSGSRSTPGRKDWDSALARLATPLSR